MKVVSLQLSNILSFGRVADISLAPIISFSDDLNIIIGENGSGKSTALEVINFLFKRVLYRQYNFNQDLYNRRIGLSFNDQRQVLQPANHNTYSGFRLDPNWSTEGEPQAIRIVVRLDEIDQVNITNLLNNLSKLTECIGRYSTQSAPGASSHGDTYTLDVTLNRTQQSFAVAFSNCTGDFGYAYLSEYNFFRGAIDLYNLENPSTPMAALYESFTLISSYRNYHTFSTSVSLRDSHAAQQIEQLRSADYSRSMNASDNSEPTIFAVVRLRIAERHFSLISEKLSEAECEAVANELSFLKEINKRLQIINLKCTIRLLNLRTWQYTFEFQDLRRGRALTDINSLSAGQKAITHLVFEAYGRGELKGGVVIIDEPEIHLHYQFQHEYLQVIRELNKLQSCQYILVTHSEALINSETINSVRRFSLNTQGLTEVRSPSLTTDQKVLVRILDNNRSTYAFFAKKVLLVEGDTDRYFFRAVLHALYPNLDQEIAVLRVAGKNEFPHWSDLFEAFGLHVYRIADLDYSYRLFYPGETPVALTTSASISGFKASHSDCEAKIAAEYHNRTYILRDGGLEQYLGIRKDLSEVINFCNSQLPQFLQSGGPRSQEAKEIVRQICL